MGIWLGVRKELPRACGLCRAGLCTPASDVPMLVAHLESLAQGVGQAVSVPAWQLCSSILASCFLEAPGDATQPRQSLSRGETAPFVLGFVPWLW